MAEKRGVKQDRANTRRDIIGHQPIRLRDDNVAPPDEKQRYANSRFLRLPRHGAVKFLAIFKLNVYLAERCCASLIGFSRKRLFIWSREMLENLSENIVVYV